MSADPSKPAVIDRRYNFPTQPRYLSCYAQTIMKNPTSLMKFACAALLLLASNLILAAAQGPAVPRLFPANNAVGISPDTPLKITFASPPVLGAGGKIQICETATKAVIETIDVSSPTATKTIGGLPDFKYYPVIITGNEAAIFPKNGSLAYNK